jgi:hypothetical protein
MGIFMVVGTAILTAGVFFEVLYRFRDAKSIVLKPNEHIGWEEAAHSPTERRFKTRMPIVNQNPYYEQTLVDVAGEVRVLTAVGCVSGEVRVRCVGGFEREDGYWQAQLLAPGEMLHCELHVTLRGAADALERATAAVVTLQYKTYGRRDLQTCTATVILPLARVKPLPQPRLGQRYAVQCVPTPILTAADDIVDVIDRHTADFRRPGDVVAVAESVVAITQGQYYEPQAVRPGFWAKRLCYFVPSKGSLSSPHGFELAMSQVGTVRMLMAFFVGAVGKLFGIKGLFYALAGQPAELIDDITGTMPPFDKYIVAGPVNARDVVDRIRAKTAMEAAIVDANDLKRVMVLAHTPGISADDLGRILIDNPFGNGDEQTPIVVLRALGEGDKGEATRDPIGTTG